MPGITIKQEQYDEIGEIIDHSYVKRTYSYSSPTDFIRAAISEHIKKMRKEMQGLKFEAKI